MKLKKSVSGSDNFAKDFSFTEVAAVACLQGKTSAQNRKHMGLPSGFGRQTMTKTYSSIKWRKLYEIHLPDLKHPLGSLKCLEAVLDLHGLYFGQVGQMRAHSGTLLLFPHHYLLVNTIISISRSMD